jgi:hypothetical protein
MTISFIDKNKRCVENNLEQNSLNKKKCSTNNHPIKKAKINKAKKGIPNLKSGPVQSAQSSKKPINQVVTGTDSIGYLPSQRNWYTYTYDIIMSILLLVSAGGFWFIFQQAVQGSFGNLQTWLYPIGAFSFLVILILIYAISVHIKQLAMISVSLALLSSLYFALEIWHGIVIVISILIVFTAIRYMRKALLNSIVVNMGSLARLGIINITLSIIFIMCSQYYWMIYDQPLKHLTQRLENVKISERVLGKVFQMRSSEESGSTKLTVDEFLGIIAKGNQATKTSSTNDNQNTQSNPNMVENLLNQVGVDTNKLNDTVDNLKTNSSQKVDELIIATMRKNLATQLGQDLNGDEYIADVFDAMMYEKIIGLVSHNKEDAGKFSSLALVLTSLLFISLLLLNTLARLFLVWLTQLVFLILRKMGIIRVITVKRETEMIIAKSSV